MNETFIKRNGKEETLPGKFSHLLVHPGETVTFLTAGGGGYGDRGETAGAIKRDVDLGYVSKDQARLNLSGCCRLNQCARTNRWRRTMQRFSRMTGLLIDSVRNSFARRRSLGASKASRLRLAELAAYTRRGSRAASWRRAPKRKARSFGTRRSRAARIRNSRKASKQNIPASRSNPIGRPARIS